MAYASASDVAVLCQNILSGQPDFSTTSSPLLNAVTTWLSSGCAVLETTLNGLGYTTPPGSDTAIYQELKDLNALYAAARVELSRTNITIGLGERTRGQIFDQMFYKGLENLRKQDLSLAGLSRSSAGRLYAGGISDSDKATNESDSDRVSPRFVREQFKFSGTTDS